MRPRSSSSAWSGMSISKERMSVDAWAVVVMALLHRRRGEEVDEQFVDACGLVVMHPVRRVRQALHAVEVGHVVAVRLREIRAEVGVALAPDDQRRRRDRAKL